MEMTEWGWGYLCDRSSRKRKEELKIYADKYITPMFDKFPELYGKVYLALRKEGFFANPHPVLHIIIPKGIMDVYTESHLKIITAHEMMHLVQYINGIGLNGWNIRYERQATFMAFARGFAYDFVRAFPGYCKKEACDMNQRICYFNCKNVFSRSCKEYSKEEMVRLASDIEAAAQRFTIDEFPDYLNIVDKAAKSLTM